MSGPREGYQRVREPLVSGHFRTENGKLPTSRSPRNPKVCNSATAGGWRRAAQEARQHVAGCNECHRSVRKQLQDAERVRAWLAGKRLYTGKPCERTYALANGTWLVCHSTDRAVRDGACRVCKRRARGVFSLLPKGRTLDTRTAFEWEAARRAARAHESHTITVSGQGVTVVGWQAGDGRRTITVFRSGQVNGVFGDRQESHDGRHHEHSGAEIALQVKRWPPLAEVLHRLEEYFE